MWNCACVSLHTLLIASRDSRFATATTDGRFAHDGQKRWDLIRDFSCSVRNTAVHWLAGHTVRGRQSQEIALDRLMHGVV